MLADIPDTWRCVNTGEMILEILLPSGMLMDLVVSMEVRVADLKLFILDQVNIVIEFPYQNY